jgi:hypothetical protein
MGRVMGRSGAVLKALFGIAVGLASAPALAQAVCDRADLQTIVDGYIAAQTSGEISKVPLADWTQYYEQMEIGSMFSGILSKPQKIDFHRSFLDTTSCSTFTEAVVADPAHPYVIGTRLQFTGKFSPIAPSRVNEISTIVTDKDDWLFNASKTMAYSKAENWGVIPEADRDTRETLIAAANAYLDYFDNKKAPVPWGSPCSRLEGGLYTGKAGPGESTPEDSCSVGVPSGVKLVERTYVVDPMIGAVAVLLQFGTNSLPDVHSFRIEKGKIRYIHTITVCKSENCGLKLSDDVKKRLEN